MSKIYVTGAAGMIGSNLCESLLIGGSRVVGVDNYWRGLPQTVERLSTREQFDFRLADIRFDSSWADDIGVDDIVVHVADIVAGIGYVFNNEFDVYKNNCLINTAVSSVIAEKRPKKIIYLGTACSYPQGMQRSVTQSVLVETDKFPADPESGYGWSKLMGQVELQLAVKNIDTQLVVLDLHNVYGWPCNYWDPRSQAIPSLIFRAISNPNDPLVVWGDGRQGRAFVNVQDVVTAVMSAINYSGAEVEFMIGPDVCTTIREIAEIIVSHSSIAIPGVEFDLSKPVGDVGRYADYSKAKSELGWEPTVNIEDGVVELIDILIKDAKSRFSNNQFKNIDL